MTFPSEILDRMVRATLGEAVAVTERWRWPLAPRLHAEMDAWRALRPAPAVPTPPTAETSSGRPGARGRRRKRRT